MLWIDGDRFLNKKVSEQCLLLWLYELETCSWPLGLDTKAFLNKKTTIITILVDEYDANCVRYWHTIHYHQGSPLQASERPGQALSAIGQSFLPFACPTDKNILSYKIV